MIRRILLMLSISWPGAAQGLEGWQTTDLVVAQLKKVDLVAHTQFRSDPNYGGVQYFRTGPTAIWRPSSRNTWTAGYWWHDSEEDFGGWQWSRRAYGGWERSWFEHRGWELRTRHWGERFWLEQGRVANRHRHRVQVQLPLPLRPAVSAEWVLLERKSVQFFRPMVVLPVLDRPHLQASIGYFYDFRSPADGGPRQVVITTFRVRLHPAP